MNGTHGGARKEICSQADIFAVESHPLEIVVCDLVGDLGAWGVS